MENMIGLLSLYKCMSIKPNFSELQRKYNIDRHTIRKYYEIGGKMERKKSSRVSGLDQYVDIINEKLKIYGITLKGIHEFLVNEKGYTGTYSTFKSYTNRKGFKKKNHTEPHVRYETDKGEVLQVDWKEDVRLVNKHGVVFIFNLFVATLGFSRMHYFIYSRTKTEVDFLRCLIEVFYKMGGKPLKVLTDNMSSIVTLRGKSKHKHAKILAFEKDLNIQIKLCKVRSPETKGKDESANRYVSRLLAYNNEFQDENDILKMIDQLNSRVNSEVNQTTNIPPIILFNKEKEYLQPLPHHHLLETYIDDVIKQVVPPTLLVNYKGCGYSVPPKFINKSVRLVPCVNKLHIYFNTELIAIHEIKKQKINYNNSHYKEALATVIKSDSIDIDEIAEQNLARLARIGGDYNEY